MYSSSCRDYSKKDEEYNVNPKSFINKITPESAYILGFLWADGYIRHDSIRLELIKTDLDDIVETFSKTGKWNYYKRSRKNRKEQATLQTNNKKLASFLKENGYKSKTYTSADKILKKIPNKYKHLWFRGFFDGDGYFSLKKGNYKVIFSGHINQDWEFLTNLLKKMGIKNSINKQKTDSGNSSKVSFYKKSDCIKFLNFIYKNPYNITSMKRKKERFEEFLDSVNTQNPRNFQYPGCTLHQS